MSLNNPCDVCELVDYCVLTEGYCETKILYNKQKEKIIMAESKKNYVWDNQAFALDGKEVEITAVYKVTAKNGNDYNQFYIKGDSENIYCTKWKKFFFVKPGTKFKVSMGSFAGKPQAVWTEIK